MDRLRPRPRPRLLFSGFTRAEVEKMEKLLNESDVKLMDKEFFQKIAKSFNCSSGRAGKPIIKWTEVQTWFQERDKHCMPMPEVVPAASPLRKTRGRSPIKAGKELPDLSELEFEAKSSTDGAWYDVESFLTHRFRNSGEAEVLVRFVGFGAEEDEWINVKKAVRERSIPLEHTECNAVKVGDLVLCFQERREQSIYYDAHVIEIQRRLHDIRGCRCLFLIRYDHDKTEERVHLRRLCRRPIQ
ncbi:protein SAWADEE HOMEODOMAIN HOMOLOG 1-like isoform X1 [Tripterygium wilfordii]|uniref:protein SAWADEE HOMEODOMAIN HOMOLOG 1-like isoform X1 n=1 Tax=Tripterygium wilfordii TaxID=458696 RepID=UPI0018F82DDF|nr:protein SAWADEE HOMEODOMAIN HOMOLOG 1-like isoform X1 [Tripterygium wilfordii]